MIKIIESKSAPRPVGSYSQAVIAGGRVFLSGQIPLDPKTNQLIKGDISAQTKQVMENIKAVLKAGGCDFSHVVKAVIFLTDMSQFSKVNAIYSLYFKEPFPARSCVEVSALPKGAQIEVEVTACTSI